MSSSKRGAVRALQVGLIAALVAAIAAAWFFGLYEYASRESLEAWVTSLGPWGPAAFVGLFVLGELLQVPSVLFVFVAGLGTGQVTALYVFRGVAPEAELLALSLVLSAGMIVLRASMGLVFAREYTREVLEESRSGAT